MLRREGYERKALITEFPMALGEFEIEGKTCFLYRVTILHVSGIKEAEALELGYPSEYAMKVAVKDALGMEMSSVVYINYYYFN